MTTFSAQLLPQVRKQNPLVHNITNIVSAHFSANGLLAIGASPFMSSSLEEMAQVADISSCLVINMGGVSDNEVAAMIACGRAMNKLGKPVILDPVGAGATPHRQSVAKRLLDEIRFDVIRGNAGEIAFLAGVDWQSHGVDAGTGRVSDLGVLAKTCATQYNCTVAISGASDYVSDGVHTAIIDNGTPLFPKITASGCLLACVVGAFVAVADRHKDAIFLATVEACAAYAIAGQLAADGLCDEYGSFYVRLIDKLAVLDNDTVNQYAAVRYL